MANYSSFEFFYSRQKNFLWRLIPTAFTEAPLKGKSKEDKLEFIAKYKIDFIDLISAVDVDEVSNYTDSDLDNNVLEWKEIIPEIRNLPNIRVYWYFASLTKLFLVR